MSESKETSHTASDRTPPSPVLYAGPAPSRRSRPLTGRLLVTGAGGFIGSHLVELAALSGLPVRAVARPNSRQDTGALQGIDPAVLENVEFAFGDVTDPVFVQSVVQDCSDVFHLASLPPLAQPSAAGSARCLIEGTIRLLEACRDAGTERFTLLSCGSAYGPARYSPIDEGHPEQGFCPSVATRIAADRIALSYCQAFGLPVVILRPFAVYGPRQRSSDPIPTLIASALSGGPVRLFGGHQAFDLLYVDDVAQALLASAATADIEGGIFNLGAGHCVTIAELARRIVTLIDARIPIEPTPALESDADDLAAQSVADWSRMEARVGWRPHTSLDAGLALTIDARRRSHRDARSQPARIADATTEANV